MEVLPEEFTGSSNGHIPIKGKRTKRQRPSSPANLPALTTSTSSSGGDDKFSAPTPMDSGGDMTYESITEEEENMANCLILLAQSGGGECGGGKRRNESCVGDRKFNDRSPATVIRLYGYECKTCNRTFSSFQALGGHRASHKKPKSAITEEKKSFITPPQTPPQFKYDRHYDDDQQGKLITKTTIIPNFTTTTLSLLHGSNHHNKSISKVHECSICGSEFTSGQALGGHMRRHRTLITSAQSNTPMNEANNRRNVLQLDLNLPAPDDELDGKFQLPLVFSSPPLLECHQ